MIVFDCVVYVCDFVCIFVYEYCYWNGVFCFCVCYDFFCCCFVYRSFRFWLENYFNEICFVFVCVFVIVYCGDFVYFDDWFY